MRAASKIAGRTTLLAAALALSCGSAGAVDLGDLYRARTAVTGQEEPNRMVGFAKCLQDVLIKLSGDPRLAADPRVAALAERAATFVDAFDYRDLMAGIPVHDEQGTRERPYALTVTFDRPRLDATLRSLGSKPWTAERPRIVVFLDVRVGSTGYLLTREADRGRDMRDALDEAAWRLGMPVALPRQAPVAEAGLTADGIAVADLPRLDTVAKMIGGDIALSGSLLWSDEALGWIADWRLNSDGKTYRWRVSGVSFDQAFRSGVGGAMQILSGHGQP